MLRSLKQGHLCSWCTIIQNDGSNYEINVELIDLSLIIDIKDILIFLKHQSSDEVAHHL